MSRRPEGLNLDEELLVRKGEARAVAPTAAVPQSGRGQVPATPNTVGDPASGYPAPAEAPVSSNPEAPLRSSKTTTAQGASDEPPIVIGKRQTIERVFTNVRIPVDLDERLYRMMVETRRKKQEIIELFVRDGLDRYDRDRRRGG
jgi:hypothetical protein